MNAWSARLKYLCGFALPAFSLVLFFGFPSVLAASSEDCTIHEASVYVSIWDASGTAVDLFCGSSMRQVARIAIPTDYAAVSVDRDRAGRLYVMEQDPRDQDIWIFQTYIHGKWSSPLSIDLAPRAMLVDRNRALAYVYRVGGHAPSSPQITVIDGTRARVMRSFPRGSDAPAPLVAPIIDGAGRVLANEDNGFVSVVNTTDGDLVKRIFAPACAMTIGNDGLFYAINCFGQMRSFDTTSYHEIGSWRATLGLIPRSDVLPRIAVDSKGILAVANPNTNRLEFYHPRNRAPFSTLGMALNEGLQVDHNDNFYFLGSQHDRYRAGELEVFRGDGSRIGAYAFAAGTYPTTMAVESL